MAPPARGRATAVDDTTVVFECSKPKPDMVRHYVPILPEHVWSKIDPEKAAKQALTIVKEGYVIAHDGTKVRVKPETLCVHGDTPTAIRILQKIREELKKAGIAVKPMGQ